MNIKLPKKINDYCKLDICYYKCQLNFVYIRLLVTNLQYLITQPKFSHISLVINWFQMMTKICIYMTISS